MELRSCRLVWVRPILDKVVDLPFLQCVDILVDVPVVQVLFLDMLRCPLLYNDRCLGCDSAENCVFLQLQFSDCTDHVILVVGCGKDASQGQYWVVRYLGRLLYEWVMSVWRLALSVLRVSVRGLLC